MRKFLLLLSCVTSLAFGDANKPLDIKEALRKADEGDPKSQNVVGYSYYEGNQLPKDPEKAIYWLRKSADAGFSPAQINLGFLYSIGFGVPKDQAEALRWYEKAAQQGNGLALFNVGSIYANGIGVPVDLTKAADYLKKATEKNITSAKLALAGLYMNGEGVPKDVTKSIALFKEAAQAGEVQAQLDLGKIYANGIGTDKDIREARYWYGMAAEKYGSKEANNALRRLDEVQRQAEKQKDAKNREFVQQLRRKYGSHLTYDTAYARSAVQSFNLDCKTNDGRYLPLEHVLLAKLASLHNDKMWLTIRADSRGEDVRIYDELISADGRIVDSNLVFELNKWGEIRTKGIRIEAILNSCFGSYGPIWVFH